MGCSTSKLDDEEAVQICKDRKRFIKQAIMHRTSFAGSHFAYIQSLKQVSSALRKYVEGDQHCKFFSNSYTSPLVTHVQRTETEIVAISLISFCGSTMQYGNNSSHTVNYIRSGGNSLVSVEEMPQSPETMEIQSYSPMHHFGIDEFFNVDPLHIFSLPSNYRRSIPPPSSQASQWDFWNPFSSLNSNGDPSWSSFVQPIIENDVITDLRHVCKEERIPDFEDENEEEEQGSNTEEYREEISPLDFDCAREVGSNHVEIEIETASELEMKGLKFHTTDRIEVSEAQNNLEVEVSHAVDETEAEKENPCFTVHVIQIPPSMDKVVKDLETQFTIACDVAREVSIFLEGNGAHYSWTSNGLTDSKMLNALAVLRSASTLSTSSRFLHASTNSREEGSDISNDHSDESCMFSGSHQSTLDRLYAWEKKLYEEVKSEERLRIEYEKKCLQFKSQDLKGEDPSLVDKTRVAIRDLETQFKVAIHSVESISKRIATLRDEKLYPQLMELIQGLARMWRAMAECHHSQKDAIDEAKLLFASQTPTKDLPPSATLLLSASNLEGEIRKWRSSFLSWISSQRSYLRSLTGWILRCAPSTEKLPSGPAQAVFSICTLWSRVLDEVSEAPVAEGLDFLAAGIGSLCGRLREEEGRRSFGGVGEAEGEEEVRFKVLCTGMEVAFNSLVEFAVASAEGYEEIVKQWEEGTWNQVENEGLLSPAII